MTGAAGDAAISNARMRRLVQVSSTGWTQATSMDGRAKAVAADIGNRS